MFRNLKFGGIGEPPGSIPAKFPAKTLHVTISLSLSLSLQLMKFSKLRDYPLMETSMFVLMSYSTFILAELAQLTGKML